jgi:hypothetical protein
MRWLALFGVGGVALWLLWPKAASAAPAPPTPPAPPSPPVKPPVVKPPVVKPPVVKPPLAQPRDNSLVLTYDEQVAIESYLLDDLYNAAMGSNHLGFVKAAADRLAAAGDTRSADLTLRAANWNS